MSIAGIGSYDYSNYSQSNVKRNYTSNTIENQFGISTYETGNVDGFTLHGVGDAEEADTLLGAMSGGGQSSISIFKTKDFDPVNPIYKVKIWDAQENETEQMVDIKKVDASNCDSVEMYAYSCYLTDSGQCPEAQDMFNRTFSFSKSNTYGADFDESLDDNMNWTQLAKEIMEMQYDCGNMSSHLDYKKFYDFMNKAVEENLNTEDSSNKTDSKNYFSEMVEQYAQKVKNQIRDGVSAPTYQIGGQSFTEEEWKELLEKVDQSIEEIKKAQEEQEENHVKKQKDDGALTEEQVYKLFTDVNERAFNSYGPNAPEVVKQAWMEAAEETGSNGAGMKANGKVTHITAMLADRAVKWINGDSSYTDTLGNSVESAIAAIEKALYDLENPLQPINTKSLEVQKQIEKEKEFYESFLDKLK